MLIYKYTLFPRTIQINFRPLAKSPPPSLENQFQELLPPPLPLAKSPSLIKKGADLSNAIFYKIENRSYSAATTFQSERFIRW